MRGQVRGRVTINDVAAEAGVSITTVSHSLNGKGRISQETRRRVAAVAAGMGYRPSASARSLAAGRSGLILITISISGDGAPAAFGNFQYYNEMLHAATSEAFDAGYALVALPDGPSQTGRLEHLEPEGVIVVDPHRGHPLIGYAHDRGIPVVTTGRTPGSDEPAVDNDHRHAATVALDHLEAMGAKRVGILGPPTDRSYIEDALEAYADWCRERGAEPIIGEATGQSPADGEATAREMLRRRKAPDGIYALIDGLGVGVLRAATVAGMSVPEDLKLVALTESSLCAQADPPLTTLNLNPELIAREAVRAVVARIKGCSDQAAPPASIPVELIVRRSCGAAA